MASMAGSQSISSGPSPLFLASSAVAAGAVIYACFHMFNSSSRAKKQQNAGGNPASATAAASAASAASAGPAHVVREPKLLIATKTLAQRQALARRLNHDGKVGVVVEEGVGNNVLRKISSVSPDSTVGTVVFTRIAHLLGIDESDLHVFVLVAGSFIVPKAGSLLPVTSRTSLTMGELYQRYHKPEDGLLYFVFMYPCERSVDHFRFLSSVVFQDATLHGAQRAYYKVAVKYALAHRDNVSVRHMTRFLLESRNYSGAFERGLCRLSESEDVPADQRNEWLDIESDVRLMLDLTPRITINTDDILKSSLEQLKDFLPQRVRCGVYVQFTSSVGKGTDEGIDQGGLFRDWLQRLADELFAVKNHFVLETFCERESKPFVSLNPYEVQMLRMGVLVADLDFVHRLMGWVVGLAVKFHVPIGIHFAPHFVKQLLGLQYDASDLQYVREGEYLVFKRVGDLSLPVQEREEALAEVKAMLGELTFAVTSRDVEAAAILGRPSRGLQHQNSIVGEHREASVVQSLDDAQDYVESLTHKYLEANVQPQLDTVRQAFYEIVGPTVTKLTPDELSLRISGIDTLSVEEWKASTHVEPEHYSTAPQLRWLWDFVDSLDETQRGQLLCWWTGFRTLPVGGFRALPNGGPRVKFVPMHGDYLPMSHTCFLRLDLPLFHTKEEMTEKLGEALQHVNFGML